MFLECTVHTMKHGGGSIIVWGCFSAADIGGLVRIDSIMKDEYRKTIEINVIPSWLHLNEPGFMFM